MLVLVIPVLVLVLVLVLLLVLLPVLLASRAAPRTLLVLLFLLVLVPHVRRRRAQQQTTLCWLSFPAKTVLGEPICLARHPADFLGGLRKTFFCPRRAEPNSRGQFLSGKAEVGRSAPFDCTR